jgi:hypothetical protein
VAAKIRVALASVILACLFASCGGSPAANPPVPGAVKIELGSDGIPLQGHPGSLWLVPERGVSIAVSVPEVGGRSIQAPPGDYKVTHRGRWVVPGQTSGFCAAMAPVVVRSGRTSDAVVVCQGR